MQRVFVLNADREPLNPCHPARARQLLKRGRAAVLRRFPFTIILKQPVCIPGAGSGYTVKVDPGAGTTGIVVVRNSDNTVVWAAELTHRGFLIHKRLQARAALRRTRRNRKLRHRPPRFNNRGDRDRRDGWLPPSLRSRIANIMTWVGRLQRLCPVTNLAVEAVKFDTQKLENPEIDGIEYQRGTLFGYEVKEYLLEKWGHRCVYCPKPKPDVEGHTTFVSVPLEIEHIIPKVRGGTDRVSNLTLACHSCNQAKGEKTAAEFGHPEVQAHVMKPLKSAAIANATRKQIWREMFATGLPVESSTGGRTKFNRDQLGLPKAHWIDAACVGESGATVKVEPTAVPLLIKAMGWGRRQRCRTDKYGFPKTYIPARKSNLGFKTGDLVRARVPSGKNKGTHVGRVTIRFRPSFLVAGHDGIHPKYITMLQQADGYDYSSGLTRQGVSGG